MSGSRRSERLQAREAILDAAERLVGVDGAASLTLRRLAEEADVTTMTLYTLFGDKAGVEEALVERAAASLGEVLAGTATLDAALDELRAWAHLHTARFSLLFLTPRLLAPDAADAARDRVQDIADTLGSVTPWVGDAEGVGTGTAGLVALSAVVGFLTFELRDSLESAGPAAFTTLVQSIAAGPRPAPAPAPAPAASSRSSRSR